MALHLVTGYSGKAHITSADQGALNAATFGRGNYVLNVGQQFAARVITNNSINVLDGEVIMQGRHIRLESGAYEEVTIENGAQGYFRNDLICIRYTKDSTTGIEEAAFVVIKGNPDASAAVDPAHNNGSILDGILTVDFPLYRVPLNGLNIGDLVALFEVNGSIDERIKALIAGTTPAGNANKLGGKSASEYALDSEILDNSLWNELTEGFDLNNALGKYRTTSGTIIASLKNMFRTGISWGELSVEWIPFADGNSYGMQIVTWKSATDLEIHCRMRDGSTWGNYYELALTADLANYLPKSGGTISTVGAAPLSVKNSGGNDVFISFSNQSKSLGMLGFMGDSTPRYYTSNWASAYTLLHEGNVGDYALPKSGGTVNNLSVETPTGKFQVIPYEETVHLRNHVSDGHVNLILRRNDILFNTVEGADYTLLHTGNSAKVAIQSTAPTDTSALWVW